jgi:hypothetical protein
MRICEWVVVEGCATSDLRGLMAFKNLREQCFGSRSPMVVDLASNLF